MNIDDSNVLHTKLKEELNDTPEELRNKSLEFARDVYQNAESFMVFVDTLKKIDDKNNSKIKYMDIAMINIITALAMDNTKNIDEAIGKVKLWFNDSLETIKECDSTINKSG